LPEVVGLVGISGDGLIVRTENGVRGLALADGAIRWRQEISDLFSFQLLDDDNLLLARRERMTDQADQWQVRLTWLNAADGKPRATSRLPELTDSDPRLGPLVPYKDRLFTFFGRGQTEPTRDFIELVPSSTADHAAAVSAWSALVPAMFSR